MTDVNSPVAGADRLEPLPEDWERALCIVAHPDDLEFGAAAAVARWTGQGKEIVYCMVTSGEVVITGNFRDSWGGMSLNQADHIAVGRGVLDAARDAGNRWIFPEQLSSTL